MKIVSTLMKGTEIRIAYERLYLFKINLAIYNSKAGEQQIELPLTNTLY